MNNSYINKKLLQIRKVLRTALFGDMIEEHSRIKEFLEWKEMGMPVPPPDFVKHITVKEYARKCNADFHIIDTIPPIMSDDNLPHFRIMELYKLLDKYDRICIIDSDALVKEDCPNLFDIVPENMIGSVLEDKGSRLIHRRRLIQDVQNIFGNVNWHEGYINTGVSGVSKMNKPIFQPINDKYWTGWGSDDIHLGWKIHKNEFKIYELSYQFNSMRCFWEPWNGSPNRLDSYIIHYAGYKYETRIKMIQEDLKALYGNKYL